MRTMFLAMALAILAGGCDDKAPETSGTDEAIPTATEEGAVYECPMHCKLEGHDEPYTQGEPGKCPVCGMNLELQKKP